MTEIKSRKISVYEITGKILGQLGETLDTSATKAKLANLRNSIGRNIETSVEIWPLIYEHVPEEFLSKNGKLTAEERAIILSLQLYAVHQQGLPTSVNNRGRKQFSNIGSSLKYLRSEENTGAIDRRFNAMITSSTFEELVNHLRYLIKLMRSKSKGNIKVNYAKLADDLYWYQRNQSQSIKLSWGRSYYSQVNSPKEEITNEQ